MKFFLLLGSLSALLSFALAIEPITAAAVIIGAKILIGKGFAYGYLGTRAAQGRDFGFGGGRRFGRDTNDLASAFLEASQRDEFDCAKLLVCSLNATPAHKLEEEEVTIANTFGQNNAIDVTLPSIEFDVAAHMGRLAGHKQCQTIYSRCTVSPKDMMKDIKKFAYYRN